MTADVLVLGESLIDVVRSKDSLARHPGGSPMNVASGLARLGVRTDFLTYLGRDADGDLIAHRLKSSGVNILPASFGSTRTGTAVATLDDDGAATYEFDIAWMLSPPSLDATPAHVHTGSLATFLDPGAAVLTEFLTAIYGQAFVSYDPNIRPSLLRDHSAALRQFESVARLAQLLKLSAEDAEWLFPGARDDELFDRLFGYGASLVVVTGGAEGARLASRSGRVAIAPVRVSVVDTIGAGDSYMSALLAFLVRHPEVDARDLAVADLIALGEWAGRAAAITVSRAGANPPHLSELDDADVA